MDEQKAQGPKEGHEDQGKHLGQQKQQAGEIGKDAVHGKSADAHNHADDEDEDLEGEEIPGETDQ